LETAILTSELQKYAVDVETVQSDVYEFSTGLKRYLTELGLPTDTVLVDIEERGKVILNLPTIVNNLPSPQKLEAYYISKFVAACSVGLFDSALNYLWNETILSLRSKVVKFDLNYFFDSTIESNKRSEFKNEDDLVKLDDYFLIKGCKDTGIITEIGYKHLDYIRDMRNFASAAHPNHTELTGFQLISWLETCINEVLSKSPEGPVLVVKKLLQNIRNEILTESIIKPIRHGIQQLPSDLISSLLRTVFGMYTDPNISLNARSNIALIAKTVWICSKDSDKRDIGLKYATLSVNGFVTRKNLAHNFLELVDGLNYLTEDQLAIKMKDCLDSLLSSHYAYYNFSNEVPHAKVLKNYIPLNGSIPKSVCPYYVKVIIICKLGNEYGVSFEAEPYYDQMIERFGDDEIIQFLHLINDNDFKIYFKYGSSRAKNFQRIAELLCENTHNEIIKQSLRILTESSISELGKLTTYSKVKSLIDEV
jgi:hypothetical protein